MTKVVKCNKGAMKNNSPKDFKKLRLEFLVLIVENDIKEVLQRKGLLDFLNKFDDYEMKISQQIASSCMRGKVKFFRCEFLVYIEFLEEIMGCEAIGENIRQDKHLLTMEMGKFFGIGENPRQEGLSMALDFLP